MKFNLAIILPEIFLAISICLLLLVGVFRKKSYKLINFLSILVLAITFFIIFNFDNNSYVVFTNSFLRDNFSNYFKLLLIISSILIIIISQQFIIDKNLSRFEYPIIILLSVLGMFFMISSNDLILFYLGLELQSLALYILAAIDRDSIKSTESGVKYFVLSALSSGLLLYGCSLLYGFIGSTNFEIISESLTSENTGAIFAMVFILVGLAFKVSAVPFHMWTPDVYEGAPTPITAFFAVVPKVAGFAVLIKFMSVPFKNILNEWQLIIIFISIASMILGAVAAIGQTNIKRLMAYSSIGHMGYALAGIATGTQNGYMSSIIYITIYVIMNIGTFACILALKKDDKYFEDIKDLSGVSNKHSLLSISFLILFFSLAGIPPLAGFFAKLYVFIAVIESKMYFLAIIGLVTTVISAFYYIRIIKIIYFDEKNIELSRIKNLGVSSAILICCFIISTYFMYPSILNRFLVNIF